MFEICINQLQYTRLGGHGIGSGWQVCAVSDRTPQRMIRAFETIAEALILGGREPDMPDVILDLRTAEGYVFLTMVNYHAQNAVGETDARGVCFLHSMGMMLADYAQMVASVPELVGRLDTDIFEHNYTGKKILDALTIWPERKCEQGGTEAAETEKFRRKISMYREQMMTGVFSALTSDHGSLRIVTGGERNAMGGIRLLTEALSEIYQSLPYIMRVKVTASSGPLPGKVIHLSCQSGEAENLMDLRSGEVLIADPDFGCRRKTSDPKPVRELVRHCVQDAAECYFQRMDSITACTWNNNYSCLYTKHLVLADRIASFSAQTSVQDVEDLMIEVFIVNDPRSNASGFSIASYDEMDEYLGKLLRLARLRGFTPADNIMEVYRFRSESTKSTLLREEVQIVQIRSTVQDQEVSSKDNVSSESAGGMFHKMNSGTDESDFVSRDVVPLTKKSLFYSLMHRR